MLTLRGDAGDSLVISPECGGAVVGWRAGRTDLLRHALPGAVTGGNVQFMGAFPLLPYANRIAFGRFRWNDVTYQLDRNFGDHPHSIHGVGWHSAWTVDAATDASARLSLHHSATGAQARSWPFAFEATLTYALEGPSLAVTLQATNRHSAAAPMGLGFHPYYPKVDGAAFRFTAAGVWMNTSNTLPERHQQPVPEAWNHRTARRAGTERLDNCFTNWTAPAYLEAGASSLRIEADAIFRNLQVYTPSWTDFCCAEPVSHVPDAINRPDLPADQAMQVLAQGESLSGTIRLVRSAPS